MVAGAVAWWIGYCTAAIQRRPRIVGPSVVAHVRGEQMSRLRGMFCPWKNLQPPAETP